MTYQRAITSLVLLASCSFSVATAAPRATAVPRATAEPAALVIIPAGTKISVNVAEPIVSNVAKTGDAFAFTTNADVVVGPAIVVRKGTVGSGTVALAGAAGGHGHEGNLHLLFDRLPTTLNAALVIGVQTDFSGHKQRLLGLISGVSLYTGFGAAVRGGQAVVVPDQPIDLVLKTDACIDPTGGTRCGQRPTSTP